MIWQHVRFAVLAGGILAVAGVSARADDCAPAPAPAPQFRTVCVNEWVPEKFEKVVTVYKQECVQEKYTAYRCETVPETKTRTVTYYENVPVEQEVVKKVCVRVPVVEERTVMEKHWVCQPETRVVRKCVDKGHYECREVPCGPSLHDRMHKFLHHKDCCDDCCEQPCRTKTVKCWVPCPTWEEHTVTCMKRVCESRPVTCKVTVCKTEVREERCKVTVCKCVPKTRVETYTCNVVHRVPYEAVRTVSRCVPTQEKVTCTRMVCHKVEKQVPVATCCEETTCCKESFFHKLSGHFKHGCGGCNDCCN
jgi:hypothetical protein